MKKVLFLLTGLMFMFTSCSDGGSDIPKNEKPNEEPPKEETASITCSIPSLSFDYEGGEKTLSFTVNKNWAISLASDISWCTISQTDGTAGTFNVSVKVAENKEYDDRNVTISIKCDNVTHNIVLTQKQKDALLITTNKYEIDKAGGSIEVEVKSNINYQIEVAEAAKGWITETTSRALTTKKHKFTIASSEEYDKREGEIYIKSGDKKETVKVYQSGGAVLVLSKKEYVVSDASETITIDIKSNFEYGIQLPGVDWISESNASRGMSSHTLKYTIAPNETYDARSAEIIFYDNNSTLKDTVTIKQAQKDAIILSEKSVAVESSESTIEVKVNSNVDFETKTLDADWISEITSARGLTEHTKYFKVAANATKSNRTGKVAFVNTTNGVSDTLTITQVQDNALIVSQKEYEVSPSGTTIDVKYQTNVEIEYEIPSEYSSWIKAVPASRGLQEYTQSFVISENDGYDSRQGTIIFKDKTGSLEETVTIKQAQKDVITLSKTEYEVKADGEIIEVEINSNVDYYISIEENWIKQVNNYTSRSINKQKLTFQIEKNKSYKQRIGYIMIFNKEKTIKQYIEVKQQQQPQDVESPGGNVNDMIWG